MNRVALLSLRVAALPLGLFCALHPFAAQAAKPVLKIVSPVGVSSKAERLIPVSQLRFNPSTKVLAAASRAGNIHCGAGSTVASGTYQLQLQGVDGSTGAPRTYTYPIMVPTTGTPLPPPISYGLASGEVALTLNGVAHTDCVSSNQWGPTANPYDLMFAAAGLPARAVGEALFYSVADKRFDVRVAQPLLCTSYYREGTTPAGLKGLSIALAGANDAAFVDSAEFRTPRTLSGLARVDYLTTGLSLQPVSNTLNGGALVQCSAPGTTVQGSPGGNASEVIFSTGFELDETPVGAPALAVQIKNRNGDAALDSLVGVPGRNFEVFRVEIANIGTATATGVRIREFAPRVGGVSPSVVEEGSALTSAATTCSLIGGVAPEACGLSLTFPLSIDNASIPAQRTLVFEVSRKFADTVPTGASAQLAHLGFAAFVDPAGGVDANLTDNGDWLAVSPVANSIPSVANPIPDQIAPETVAYSFAFAANTFADTDVSDTLTYTASLDGGGALPAWLSFDPASRTFSGTPAVSDVGTVQVRVSADDGRGGSVSDVFALKVNAAPVLAAAIADQAATEDAAFNFSFAADAFTDRNPGEVLSYTATRADDSALPAWLSFNAATRSFSGTPSNADVGTLDIKVTASDGSVSVSDTFSLAVANANDAPTVANPIAAQAATEDAAFAFAFAENTFADVDAGAVLSYAATLADDSALPAWLSFAAATRSFSGTPADADVGELSIKVTASDGNGGTVSTTFALTVNPLDKAPSFTLSHSSLVLYRTGSDFDPRDATNESAASPFAGAASITCADGSVCSVTLSNLVQAANANDAGEQVRLVTGALGHCSVLQPSDGSVAVTAAFAMDSVPPMLPASAFVASGGNFDVRLAYKKAVPTGTRMECLIYLEDDGAPANLRSADLPAHRLSLEFKDAPPP